MLEHVILRLFAISITMENNIIKELQFVEKEMSAKEKNRKKRHFLSGIFSTSAKFIILGNLQTFAKNL